MRKTRETSEKGSIILLVLIVLMLVSMFGISALNTSSTEMMISKNGRCYKQNVYRAEAALFEVAEVLESESDPTTHLLPANMDPTPKYDFFSITGSPMNIPDTIDPENTITPENVPWILSGAGKNATTATMFTDDASGFTVLFEGLARGESYNMTAARMWQYGVYGVAQLCDGNVGVIGGYRRRF